MPSVNVSTIDEVLEQFRLDLLTDLEFRCVAIPAEAKVSGNCLAALVAWQRLEHRRISAVPRRVGESTELLGRDLDQASRSALLDIRSEFERGEDMTQRLTRQFYRSAFNDFLFNNFGIQHLHLGDRNAGMDKTKNHPMSGGRTDLLFALVMPAVVYFLDVLDHQVFDNVEMAKSLVRIALRNRRDLLERYIAPGVVEAEQTFEDAFAIARSGCVTVYELDGAFFLPGDTVLDGRVVDGKRKPCTSSEVVDAANHVLNLVVDLVEYVQANADALASLIESDTGVRLVEFKLVVVCSGTVVIVHDDHTDTEFLTDGRRRGYRHSQAARVTQLL